MHVLAKPRRGRKPARRRPLHHAQDVKVAEEVWIATALLHHENPRRNDFAVEEIIARARKENITGKLRPSVYAHVVQHCVANKPPSPSRLRYLIESRPGYRKLFRYPYATNFYRLGGKKLPRPEDLPATHRALLNWYAREYNVMTPERAEKDTILALCGLGKEIWAGVDPDEYVRQLREGWK